MIESVITTSVAKDIFKAKLKTVVLPSLLLGLTFGMYQGYTVLQDPFLIFGVVMPITILLAALAGYIGLRIGISRILNTQYTLGDGRMTKTDSSGTVIIDMQTISKVKENMFELTVVAGKSKIILPKELPNYGVFKSE